MATAADIVIARSTNTPSITFPTYNAGRAALTGAIHELFTAVSPTQALNGYTDYRLLMIYNINVAEALDGLKIYVSSQTTSLSTEIYLAVASGTFNATNPVYTSGPTKPSISTVTSTPDDATFYPAASFDDALVLPTLAASVSDSSLNACFVWVKRVVSAGASALASDFGTITVTNRV